MWCSAVPWLVSLGRMVSAPHSGNMTDDVPCWQRHITSMLPSLATKRRDKKGEKASLQTKTKLPVRMSWLSGVPVLNPEVWLQSKSHIPLKHRRWPVMPKPWKWRDGEMQPVKEYRLYLQGTPGASKTSLSGRTRDSLLAESQSSIVPFPLYRYQQT